MIAFGFSCFFKKDNRFVLLFFYNFNVLILKINKSCSLFPNQSDIEGQNQKKNQLKKLKDKKQKKTYSISG